MRNLLLAVALSSIGTAHAAPNLLQVDAWPLNYPCANDLEYKNIPGLSVDMRTNGRPVVVTISALAGVTAGQSMFKVRYLLLPITPL